MYDDAPDAPAAPGQFAFWVGRWRVTDEGPGDSGRTGVNVVSWLYDGAVLQESFSMQQEDGTLFQGRSLSVPDPRRGWCQTWADSAGHYLDFTGGWRGDRMVLDRVDSRTGVEVRQRMVWYDIGAHAFTWDWLRSTDGGTDWQLAWRLTYSRDGDS
jgi:hypothetical protein